MPPHTRQPNQQLLPLEVFDQTLLFLSSTFSKKTLFSPLVYGFYGGESFDFSMLKFTDSSMNFQSI
jgi:hypothetical protein